MSPFNQFLLLLKKESLYIWRDKKTLFTSIVLSILITPLLIFGITQLTKVTTSDLAGKSKIIAITQSNNSDSFTQFVSTKLTENYQIKQYDLPESETKLNSNDVQLIITEKNDANETQITLKSDPRSNLSTFTLSAVQKLYAEYTSIRASKILAQSNITLDQVYDTKLKLEEVKVQGSSDGFLTFFIPYILILGLVQGGMQYAMEATSGEKERNTLATTLSLAVSPSIVGIAKIVNVLLWSFGTTLLNIVSLLLTFKFFGTVNTSSSIDLSGFGLDKALQLIGVALPLSLLLATTMVALGLYARNLKEGYSYATPLLFISIFAAVSSQFLDSSTPLYFFAIPILGHIAAIKLVIFGTIGLNAILMVTGVTLALFALVFWITTRMFTREEVLFRV
jgi:sodium transport system permease protein